MQKNNQSTAQYYADIAIIGGGPAGITASIYTAYDGLVPLFLEAKSLAWIPEKHINLLPKVEGLPTQLNKINGTQLVEKLRHSLAEMGVNPLERIDVEKVKKVPNGFLIQIAHMPTVLVRAVILCTGTLPASLGLEKEETFAKTNLHYFAYGTGEKYCGKKVIVLGSRNSGSTAAKYLAESGAKVTIMEIKDKVQAKEKHTKHFKPLGIKVLLGSRVVKLLGDSEISAIEFLCDNRKNKMSTDAVFVYIGNEPNNRLAKELGVKLDEFGYVKVNNRQETNIPGVFAAGDLCGNLKHIAAASGQGATAAYCANKFITTQFGDIRSSN